MLISVLRGYINEFSRSWVGADCFRGGRSPRQHGSNNFVTSTVEIYCCYAISASDRSTSNCFSGSNTPENQYLSYTRHNSINKLTNPPFGQAVSILYALLHPVATCAHWLGAVCISAFSYMICLSLGLIITTCEMQRWHTNGSLP